MQRLTQTRKFGLILWTLVMRFCTCITIDLVAVFYDLENVFNCDFYSKNEITI